MQEMISRWHWIGLNSSLVSSQIGAFISPALTDCTFDFLKSEDIPVRGFHISLSLQPDRRGTYWKRIVKDFHSKEWVLLISNSNVDIHGRPIGQTSLSIEAFQADCFCSNSGKQHTEFHFDYEVLMKVVDPNQRQTLRFPAIKKVEKL